MKPFKHILLPTDFGSSTPAAVDLAIALAEAFDTELTLMHCWEMPVYPYMDVVLRSDELIEMVQRAAAQGLEHALSELQKRAPRAKSALRMGLPWHQIIDASAELGCDLIVMGTQGHQGLSHALLGSVAEKVVRLSTVPVLVTHPPRAA